MRGVTDDPRGPRKSYFAIALVFARQRRRFDSAFVASARLTVREPVVTGSAFVALGTVVSFQTVAQSRTLRAVKYCH